MRSFLYTVRV